jgi:hypothetical protein
MAAHETPSDKPQVAEKPDEKAMTPSDKPKKTKIGGYMTRTDEKPIKKLSEERVYPKAVNAAPKSAGQLILYELPVFFHLPLFFIYNLTLDQTLLLMQNVLISLVLSFIVIDLINRFKVGLSSKAILSIIIILFVGFNIFILYRVFLWGQVWEIKQFPVFARMFA